MRYANVTKDGFSVPLIGVPESSVLELCDLCGDEFPIRQLEFNGKQMLCQKCRKFELGDNHYDHCCTGKPEDACHTSNVKRHKRRVFCASLSDWLDEAWPIEVLADLLKLIHDTPNLDWLLLTKRPENWRARMNSIMEFLFDKPSTYPVLWEFVYRWSHKLSPSYPDNVWFGTTVEDQKRADQRIPELLKIPAKVRFLSVEPMLEDIALDHYFDPMDGGYVIGVPEIHWVICGGESGPNRRPFNCDWARSIKGQCEDAGVAFFMKQIDKVRTIPDDLMIRQFPNL